MSLSIDAINIWDLRRGEAPKSFNGLIFEQTSKDTVGNAGSDWGKVWSLNNPDVKKSVLLKYHDYEYTDISLNEWLYSEIAHLLLDNTRIPDIQRGKLGSDRVALSYNLVDNDAEDFIHMDFIYRKKFSEEKIKTMNAIGIDDVLYCLKVEIKGEENYKEVEKEVVKLVILDCLTSNVDRHGKNWGVVRNKNTNRYELMAIDHSLAFINMIDERPGVVDGDKWSPSVVGTETGKGTKAKDTIKYLRKNFPEYFEEFRKSVGENKERIAEAWKEVQTEGNLIGRNNELIHRFNALEKDLYRERGEYEYDQ